MVPVAEELQMWDWMGEVVKQLASIQHKVSEPHELSEEDYKLLRVLFRVWDNGELPLYQMEPVIPGETPRQLPLFDDNMTLFGSGTEIAGAVKDTALVSC